MKPQTIKILYWTLTILFTLMLTADGIAGLMQEHSGQVVMQQLGYPVYIMQILGLAKLLAAVALIQNRFYTIKEWAFAGFTINCIGASMSWYFIGKGAVEVGFPLLMLALFLTLYALWHRYRQLATAQAPVPQKVAAQA